MAGTLVADTLQDGAGNSTSMDNAIYGSAKAWVQFDGTVSSPTINGSYNISSVTKSSTALFTINFTTALSNTYYAVVATAGTSLGNTSANAIIVSANPINASSCFYNTRNAANSDSSYSINSVAVFR